MHMYSGHGARGTYTGVTAGGCAPLLEPVRESQGATPVEQPFSTSLPNRRHWLPDVSLVYMYMYIDIDIMIDIDIRIREDILDLDPH